MTLKPLAFATLLALGSSTAAAAESWIDWYTATNWAGNHTGELAIDSEVWGITLSGTTNRFEVEGTAPFNYAGAFGTLSPSDMIQLNSSASPIDITVTFGGHAVVDPYLALVSAGDNSAPITYTFSGDGHIGTDTSMNSVPSILSSWTSGGAGAVSGQTFIGGTNPFTGVLQFTGEYTFLRIQTTTGDSFSGFNIGTSMGAVTPPVPEPETFAMMLAGIGLLGVGARRRRSAN